MDIKPSNFMVTNDNTIKLGDFDFAVKIHGTEGEYLCERLLIEMMVRACIEKKNTTPANSYFHTTTLEETLTAFRQTFIGTNDSS
jgi:serine/threonine protein kinase